MPQLLRGVIFIVAPTVLYVLRVCSIVSQITTKNVPTYFYNIITKAWLKF